MADRLMSLWQAYKESAASTVLNVAFFVASVGYQVYEYGTKHNLLQEEMEDSFTRGTVAYLASQYPDKNVLVYHDQNSIPKLEGVVEHHHYELPLDRLRTQGYEIVIFDSGSFTLAGDGGYPNWCFEGKYRMNGTHHVDFAPITPPTASGIQRRATRHATIPLTFDFAPFATPLNVSVKNSTGSGSGVSHTPLHAPITHTPAPAPNEPMIRPLSPAPAMNGSEVSSHLVQCRSTDNGTAIQGFAHYRDLDLGPDADRVPDDLVWLVELSRPNGVVAPGSTAHGDWSLPIGAVTYAEPTAAFHWRLFGNAASDSVAVGQACGVADDGFEHFWVYKGDGGRLFSISGWDCDSLFYAF